MPSQLDNVAEGKDAMKPHATAAGTDGGVYVRLHRRYFYPIGAPARPRPFPVYFEAAAGLLD